MPATSATAIGLAEHRRHRAQQLPGAGVAAAVLDVSESSTTIPVKSVVATRATISASSPSPSARRRDQHLGEDPGEGEHDGGGRHQHGAWSTSIWNVLRITTPTSICRVTARAPPPSHRRRSRSSVLARTIRTAWDERRPRLAAAASPRPRSAAAASEAFWLARRRSRSWRLMPLGPCSCSPTYIRLISFSTASATACCCSRVKSFRLPNASACRTGLSPSESGGASSCARGRSRRSRSARSAAPVLSAIRPRPGFADSASLPVRERPPSQYIASAPPFFEDRFRSDERLLVARSAPDREHAAMAVEQLQRAFEHLRLRHEAHLAPQEAGHQKMIHEREVVWREDDGAATWHVLGRDRADTQQREGIDRGDQPRELVGSVRLVRARALSESAQSAPAGRGSVYTWARRGARSLIVWSRDRASSVIRRAPQAEVRGRDRTCRCLPPKQHFVTRLRCLALVSRYLALVPDVEAHITGTIWKIECAVGDEIVEGDTVAILK